MNRLNELGIIHGDNINCFEPLELSTMAESAVIIYNTAKYLDQQGKFTLAQFKFDDSL